MERYRRAGGQAVVEAIQLTSENVEEIRSLVTGSQIVDEKDPFTQEVSQALNIPTPSEIKRLSEGQYLLRYAGQWDVCYPGWFRRNYIPVEVPRGELSKDVRDSKILKDRTDET